MRGTPIHWVLQVRKRLLWEVCDLPEPSCWKRWAGFAACVSVFSASSISLQLHQGRGLREMESLSETDGPLLPHDPLGFLFRLADGSTQGKITSRRLRPRKERGLLLLPGVWQVSDLYHGREWMAVHLWAPVMNHPFHVSSTWEGGLLHRVK